MFQPPSGQRLWNDSVLELQDERLNLLGTNFRCRQVDRTLIAQSANRRLHPTARSCDIAGKQQEHFVCISLNGANEVIEKRVVTIGLLDKSPVHPREVFADVIADRAAAVIFAHNHPSGELQPSEADLQMHEQLTEAGKILGIRVLDHIIVTRKGHFSFQEAGLIRSFL